MTLFIIFTLIATALFVRGYLSLQKFAKKMQQKNSSDTNDPFHTIVAVLFSPDIQDETLRRDQKRIIGLFCGAILCLFIAASFLRQTI